jgi:hypothetical protein
MISSKPSSLDEFLNERAARNRTSSDATLAMPPQVVQEWGRLKEQLRALVGDRRVDGEQLEWSPYPAPHPDFLLWKNVAAYFVEPDVRRERAPAFRIRFSRRPLKANQIWVLSESPIEEKVWKLDYREATERTVWVMANGRMLSSQELAHAIAIELVKFSDAYESAARGVLL